MLRELERPELELVGASLLDLLAPAYATFDAAGEQPAGTDGGAGARRPRTG